MTTSQSQPLWVIRKGKLHNLGAVDLTRAFETDILCAIYLLFFIYSVILLLVMSEHY